MVTATVKDPRDCGIRGYATRPGFMAVKEESVLALASAC